MKSAVLTLLLALSVVSQAPAQAAQPSRHLAVPAGLVAKTVAWQAHWDEKAGIAGETPAVIAFRMRDQSEAWILGQDWIVSFAQWDGQPLPNYVQRLAAPGDEVRERALLPFRNLTNWTARVPGYTNSFRPVRALHRELRARLLDVFAQKACDSENLAFYKERLEQLSGLLRFWIAPVDSGFPIILYFVEGMPYLGKVYFHTRSLKPLYSEFNYITDEGSETHQQRATLMAAIRAEGDLFELRNGRPTPVER